MDRFITSHNSVYDFSSLLEADRAVAGTGEVTQTSRRPGTQDNPFMQLLQHLLELRFLEGRWQQLESDTHKLVILQVTSRVNLRKKTFENVC